jgi:DNA-binding response OmpR family regulator
VEDEARVAGFIAKGLREQCYAADAAQDGEQALYHAAAKEYSLAIPDVMLPARHGYRLWREPRGASFRAPIPMLTARDSVDDRVAGRP